MDTDSTYSIPDYTEPIIAARAWRVLERLVPVVPPSTAYYIVEGEDPLISGGIETRTEYRLKSPYKDGGWNPGETFEATCTSAPEVVLHNVRIDQQNEVQEIMSFQSFYPIRQIVNKRLLIEAAFYVFNQEALERGVTLRLNPKSGQFELTSVNDEQAEPPPHPEHQCGVYAVSTPEGLLEQRAIISSPATGWITGLVELTGRVIPASRGWRAQYGNVRALIGDQYLSKNSTTALAETYDVPVLPFHEAMKQLSNPQDFRRDK